MPPPRLRLRSKDLRRALNASHHAPQLQCRYASTAAAITSAASIEGAFNSVPPTQRFPPTQPPSHKRPEFRKSQLHRQYTSLLRSSPLILIFQHNNLTSAEWMGIRRELARALRKADEELAAKAANGHDELLAEGIKLNIIQTGIFGAALRIVDFYNPAAAPETKVPSATDPATASSAEIPSQPLASSDPTYSHGLSTAAYNSARKDKSLKHGFEPLLSGPLAILPFPAISPAHLAAALRTLAPNTQFAAPKRKANPTYHEPAVQSGLQKLMLLGARVESKVFDDASVRWVGGIQGGLDGLRAQLVAVLTAAGASLTRTLETASSSVFFTMEGRRQQLEDAEKPNADGPA